MRNGKDVFTAIRCSHEIMFTLKRNQNHVILISVSLLLTGMKTREDI